SARSWPKPDFGTYVGPADPYVAPVAQAGVSATVRAIPHRLVVDGFLESEPQSKRGMGIGLSICHSIIESHNGRIWVTRGIDKGSIFQFELPTQRGPGGSSSPTSSLNNDARSITCRVGLNRSSTDQVMSACRDAIRQTRGKLSGVH